MKKNIPQYDYEHRLEPDLLRFLTRIESLEKESKELNAFIHMKELDWDSHISELKRNTERFRSQAMSLKQRMDSSKKLFVDIVEDFKHKADKDDLRKLESKIDNLDFENLISKREFLRKGGF